LQSEKSFTLTSLTKLLLILLGCAAFAGTAFGADPQVDPAVAGDLSEKSVQLTLEQAIQLALRANRGVSVASNQVESRGLSLEAAQSEFDVKFVPALDASASGSGGIDGTAEDLRLAGALEKKFELGPTGAVVPRVAKSDIGEYTSAIGLELNIPLFRDFGREVNLDAVDSANFGLQESGYALYLTRDRTVLDTVAAVYAVIEQSELLDLYTARVARYAEHADAARVKEKAGLASPIDAYRAEISRQDAQAALSRTQKALADAGDRLKVLLTLPLDRDLRVSAPLDTDPVRLDSETALEIALDNRVEFKRARDRVDDALRRSRIAKQGILPDVNLVLGYERAGSGEDFDRSTPLDENNWRVALFGRTSFPRTFEKAAFRQSLITVRTERLNLAAVRDEIERDVRSRLEALKQAEDDIAIRQMQIDTAEGKLALARIKFRYEMADNFDVIESENELERATVDLLAARTDYIVGIYRLRSALGTLLE
jgi:outer membrane protein TolC